MTRYEGWSKLQKVMDPIENKVDARTITLQEHMQRMAEASVKSSKAKITRKINQLKMMAKKHPNHPKWGQHRLEDNINRVLKNELYNQEVIL